MYLGQTASIEGKQNLNGYTLISCIAEQIKLWPLNCKKTIRYIHAISPFGSGFSVFTFGIHRSHVYIILLFLFILFIYPRIFSQFIVWKLNVVVECRKSWRTWGTGIYRKIISIEKYVTFVLSQPGFNVVIKIIGLIITQLINQVMYKVAKSIKPQ